MKKALALLLVGFMVLGAKLALADTRTDSLGLAAGHQIDDLDSIWLFPQDAANFGNVVDYRLEGIGGTGDDWGGIIHKDFDEIGYIGVYTNRPFNQAFGVAPNTNAADQNGILNGFTSWSFMINPSSSSYWGSNYLYDPDGNIGGHYAYWPYGENAALNYYVNFWFGAGMNLIKVADPENKADIFWAKDFADATIGVHLNYANQSGGDNEYGNGNGSGTGNQTQGTPTLFGQQTSTFNNDSSVIGVDLGATLKSINLSLGLGYSLGSVNYKEVYAQNYVTAGTMTTWDNSQIKDNNISEIRVNALLKGKVNDTTTSRVYLSGHLDNLGFQNNVQWDQDGDGTFGNVAGEVFKGTDTYTDTNVDFGFACDHNVADGKAHVIASLGIIYDGRKWTQTAMNNLAGSTTADQVLGGSGSTYNEDWWVVPFNFAVEAPLFDWLKARVGASHNLYNNITGKITQLTNPNAGGTAFQDTTTISNGWDLPSNLDISYGASAQFQNFTVDLQINPNTFENYLTAFQPGSGIFYAPVGGMFTQADIRYAF